jgi:phage FluMu protein Com
MAETNGERYSVTCPHCRKAFVGELLTGDAQRYHGFKCPHCKLFVPAERADESAEEPMVPPRAPSL